MPYDTGFGISDYPDHKCGKVLDYCRFNDTKIYFCIFCKKVIGAKKELSDDVNIQVNVYLASEDIEFQRNELDPEQKKNWV